eukprot:SAG31_NODE_483_length_15042_cov_28.867764_5_plen_120_part_00
MPCMVSIEPHRRVPCLLSRMIFYNNAAGASAGHPDEVKLAPRASQISMQFKELWEPPKYRELLRAKAPELHAGLSTPLAGWKIAEAYLLFATTKVADDALPWYETVVVQRVQWRLKREH